MSTRTVGQATFEAFQRERYPHPGQRTDWDHEAVDASRPAWEAGGMGAIEFGAGPALVRAIEAERVSRELLARVRLILGNGELSEAEARQAAIEVIQQSESREETSA